MKLAQVYGVKIAYFDSDPAATSGKPCLFFMHGWAGNSSSFQRQIDSLSVDYRCIAVDLPGHGKSAKPAFEYTIVLFAEIMIGLCKKLKLTEPVILGHSMGGCIALEMVHQQPDIAKAVVLVDPALILPTQKITQVFQDSLDALKQEGIRAFISTQARRMFFDKQTPKHLLDWAAKSARLLPEHVAVSAWGAMLDWQGKAALRAVAAQMPVAYIASSRPSNKLEDVRAVAPKIEWAQPMKANHNLHIESATQVNAMIADFIESLGILDTPSEQPPMRASL